MGDFRERRIQSASLYLVHFPLLALSYIWVSRLSLSADARLIIMLLVVAPATLPVAHLFHLGFERPFMSLRPSPGRVPIRRLWVSNSASVPPASVQ